MVRSTESIAEEDEFPNDDDVRLENNLVKNQNEQLPLPSTTIAT